MRRPRVLAGVALVCIALTACVPPPPPPPSLPTFGVNLKLTFVTDPGGAITMSERAAASDTALYIGTKDGRVIRFDGTTQSTVLDISADVEDGGECGLLGMDFSPDGSKLYVHYSSGSTCTTNVVEYMFEDSTHTALPATARTVLTEPQPQTNHKGGSILFGPDGKLYIALGDGGGGNDDYPGYSTHDSGGNAQSLNNNLKGKVFRIDPTDPDGSGSATYTIPSDNPFAGGGDPGRDEIWSYGLRNPFRMSFDRSTGDLWIGDVGQTSREEIDWVAASDPAHPGGKGSNFGWNRFEGEIAGPDPSPPNGAVTAPVLPINRSQGDKAIVGGYVYRGSAIPELDGVYLHADFFHTDIRGIRIDSNGVVVAAQDFLVGASDTASFGEDASGELYVVSLSSGVYKIEKA